MATISHHHVVNSMAGCNLDFASKRQLLTRAGINPSHVLESNDRIHTDQVARLYRLIQQDLDDEFMGFTRHGCRFGSFAMMGELVRHCKTLGDALQLGIRFYNLISREVTLSLETSGRSAVFSLQLKEPSLDLYHFLTEFLLVIWHRFPSWYIGEAIRLQATHFAHSAPVHLTELQIMFPGRLRFNQDANRLMFDADYLKKPLCRTGRELDIFLAENPADIMTLPVDDRGLEATIERIILKPGDDHLTFPSAPEIARALGISTLTMYRKLQQESTSYQKIKDNLRREVAIKKLVNDHLSVEDVSTLVGFSEARSFTRAFKQWTGLSPRDYCRQYK